MRPFTKCCCGRLHASSSAERLGDDSGWFGQMGNGLKKVMRITDTSGSNLEISVDQVGTDAIVRPSGRINVDSSPDLRDCLSAILSKESLPRAITVDLTGVPYIDTSGIATLIEALRIARHHQTIFCLEGLSGSVLRLFEVTGVLDLFEASACKGKVS
ncbi:MAG: metal transporter ATPase [Candidatus Sulfotelmatobacter sp.]|nr:metal transporter ATPase [Candidatus Sulfotelmatobacter sp.]